MYSLNGNGIRNMIYGATIFGGGGGGACSSGEMALDQFKEDHGITDDADLMVQVMSPEEMDDAANGRPHQVQRSPHRPLHQRFL